MRPLTILLLLVAVAAGLCAGLLHPPSAVFVARLLSCTAFVAATITFAIGLPRRPDQPTQASGPPPRHHDRSFSARG